MLQANLSIIAETLVQEGFQKVQRGNLSFEGDIKTHDLHFRVRFSKIDPLFLRLPTATLLSIPDEIEHKLPHIEHNNKLCYLDKSNTYLDPFEPKRTTLIIVGAVKSLLDSYFEEAQVSDDFADEFGSYWEGKYRCCLITNQQSGISNLIKSRDLEGKNLSEFIIVADDEELQYWCSRRSSTKSDMGPSNKAIILSIEEPLVVEHNAWPPQAWPEFIKWLRLCHPETERKLLQNLLTTLKDSKNITIALRSERAGPFGVHVQFTKKLRIIAERFNSSKNSKANRRGRKPPWLHFQTVISNQNLVSSFSRLDIVDVSEKFVYERNLLSSSLLNRKIAILGCGTVGSFAANLLVKAGAGTGQYGKLDLFDEDLLSSSNLGRHLLGVDYLFERKGAALADYLIKSAIHQTKIEGFENFQLSNLCRVSKYDLVIDTTGDETFCMLLAYGMHELRRQNMCPPPLLHAWVDASGRAVRALIDDNSGACFRCLKVKKGGGLFEELIERYPLFKNQKDEGIARLTHFRCGESYIPFAAGVSSSVAGMVQQMALDVFKEDPGPRFRHQSFDTCIQNTKSKSPNKVTGCPCCNPN